MKDFMQKIPTWVRIVIGMVLFCCYISAHGEGSLKTYLYAVLLAAWIALCLTIKCKPENQTQPFMRTDPSAPAFRQPMPTRQSAPVNPVSAPEPEEPDLQEAVPVAPPKPKPDIFYGKFKYKDISQIKNYVVVDVETTGLDPAINEIIEIAAIRCADGRVDSYHSLVKPSRSIPPFITNLTGISNADVADAPSITDIMPYVYAFISGLPLVAHNAPFDVKFLCYAFHKAGISIDIDYIDTLELSRKAFPDMENHKLATLIENLHLSDSEQEHRAGSDTEATMKLFELCQKEIPRQKELAKLAKKQAAAEEKARNLNQYAMQAEADGDIAKAIGYYEDLLHGEIIQPNAYMRLAILYKKNQQWADVVRVCDAALADLSGKPGKICQPEEYEKRKAYALKKMETESKAEAITV